MKTSTTDGDATLDAIVAACRPFSALSREEGYALARVSCSIDRRGIPGALVACGAWRGGAAMTMAMAVSTPRHRPGRDVYLYDTFSGMVRPGDDDRAPDGAPLRDRWQAQALPHTNRWWHASRAEAERNVLSTGLPGRHLFIIEGDLRSTLMSQRPAEIAVLHVDTGLHESTAVALRALLPLISPGGAVLVSGYRTLRGVRKAVDAEFAAWKARRETCLCDDGILATGCRAEEPARFTPSVVLAGM